MCQDEAYKGNFSSKYLSLYVFSTILNVWVPSMSPVTVSYRVHSLQTKWIMLPAWFCMMYLEDSWSHSTSNLGKNKLGPKGRLSSTGGTQPLYTGYSTIVHRVCSLRGTDGQAVFSTGYRRPGCHLLEVLNHCTQGVFSTGYRRPGCHLLEVLNHYTQDVFSTGYRRPGCHLLAQSDF